MSGSEFHQLDLRDLDPSNHQLHVRKGEGGKERNVPFTGNLYQHIRLYAGERRAESSRTSPCAPCSAGTTTPLGQRPSRRKADRTPPGTRSPTILRAMGFSLEEIQPMLGHSSRTTTEIYAKLMFTPETRDRYLQLFEGGAYKR